MPQHREVERRSVSCGIANGLPIAEGRAHSDYVSRQDGRRMLVVQRRSGESLRINGPVEVVILETHLNRVKLAIECLSNDGAKS